MLAIFLPGQCVYHVQISHDQVVHLCGRVVHESTEFDHLSGMSSAHFGRWFVPIALDVVYLEWLGEQQFVGTHPVD